MDMTKMVHVATRTKDGLIHVTNIVGIYVGQHHVHDQAGYVQWKQGIDPAAITFSDAKFGTCSCGLSNGEARQGL